MNILYHIPQLNQAAGGVRQYSVALLNILSKGKPDNRYYVLHNNNDPLILEIIEKSNALILIRAGSREKKVEKFLRRFSRLLNEVFEKLNWKIRCKQYHYLNRICRKYKIDIIHSPNQTTPETRRAKRICTMHDIQEIHFPEYFTAEERKARAIGSLNSLYQADLIVVSYNHIKKDIIKYFQIPDDKICVCLLDMQNLWFKKFEEGREKYPDNFPASEKYLLYPANTYKHKNHIRLLESVAYLRDQKNDKINIICTGNKNQHFSESIYPKLKELDLEDQVQFLGIVDEETLFALYKKATGVVVPTVYEAGSFPLMESMLLQVPVICSNVTSLPETIGDVRFIFDPFNIEDMAAKMSLIYHDAGYRDQNIQNSKMKSKDILNTKAYEIIQSAYAGLLTRK